MADTYTNKVKRGAKFLDQHFGLDWPLIVNLDRLKMDSHCSCVIGQLTGSFYWIIAYTDSHGMTDRDGERMGFDASHEIDTPIVDQYEALDKAWADLIRHRQRILS